MGDPGAIVGDRRAGAGRGDPVSQAGEDAAQLGGGKQVKQHERVRLLAGLVAADGVALGLQDQVQPADVPVTRAVGVQVDRLQPLIPGELADHPVMERDVQPP